MAAISSPVIACARTSCQIGAFGDREVHSMVEQLTLTSDSIHPPENRIKETSQRSGSRLRIWRCHPAPAITKALTEFFPFLRRPLSPTVPHAMKPAPASACRTAESPEQDFAQDDQAYGLPVANQFQSKEGRHQPIPQAHDYEPKPGKHGNKQHCEQHKFHDAKNVMAFHLLSLLYFHKFVVT